jgi:hypothetical protein
MPTLTAVKVPVSIAHFAYQPAATGVSAPGFRSLVELMRSGNTWMKISGANRVSTTDLPPYDDVKPMAEVIEAAPDRIMWGTDSGIALISIGMPPLLSVLNRTPRAPRASSAASSASRISMATAITARARSGVSALSRPMASRIAKLSTP